MSGKEWPSSDHLMFVYRQWRRDKLRAGYMEPDVLLSTTQSLPIADIAWGGTGGYTLEDCRAMFISCSIRRGTRSFRIYLVICASYFLLLFSLFCGYFLFPPPPFILFYYLAFLCFSLF